MHCCIGKKGKEVFCVCVYIILNIKYDIYVNYLLEGKFSRKCAYKPREKQNDQGFLSF